jgi:hypothetical protein
MTVTVTPLPFSGATFFADVRPKMQADRGMFVGSDGDFRYVCVDPAFYRIGAFLRPFGSTFSGSAATATGAKVIANGQFFDSYLPVKSPVPWEGEVIADGGVQPGGVPGGKPAMRYVGQWPGMSVPAVAFGRGDPSTVSPPLQAALGALVPLIEGGAGATAKQMGTWVMAGPRWGKTIYGLHRSEGVLFVLVQVHSGPGSASGLDIFAVRSNLMTMGVDDAVLADGSDSATLLVDGSVLVQPGLLKDVNIPCGLALSLHGLGLTAPSQLVLAPTTTDPVVAATFSVTGVTGTLRLATPGAVLELTNLGTPSVGTPAQLLHDLELTLPLSLVTPTAPVRPGGTIDLESPAGAADVKLTLNPGQVSDGTLTGSLVVFTPRGHVDFDVSWTVADVP